MNHKNNLLKYKANEEDDKLIKLNLASGKNILKNYINVDRFKYQGVNEIFDATKFPYPFRDNFFDEIYIRHFLNHIPESDRINIMEELFRIGKNGCIVKILVPYAWSNGSFGHIEHQSHFVKGIFNYYQVDGGFADIKESKSIFKVLKEELICYGRFRRFLPFKNLLSKFLINIYDDIYYELRIKK